MTDNPSVPKRRNGDRIAWIVLAIVIALLLAGWLVICFPRSHADIAHAALYVLRTVVSANALAAVIVWLGVRTTARVTLDVAKRNRDSTEKTAADRLAYEQKAADDRVRSEREAATWDRVFQPRAEAYVAARNLLLERLSSSLVTPPEAGLSNSEPFRDAITRIAIYGGPAAGDRFSEALKALDSYDQARRQEPPTEAEALAFTLAEKSVRAFDQLARANLGLHAGATSGDT